MVIKPACPGSHEIHRFEHSTAILACVFYVERYIPRDPMMGVGNWIVTCNHPEILQSLGEFLNTDTIERVETILAAYWNAFREDFARRLRALNG